MSHRLVVRPRFWVESTVTALAFGLAAVTLIRRDWIEIIFGVDPDRDSGAVEWAIVGTLLAAALVSALLARTEWRKRHALPD
jgi:hypothetical protein